jgi:hypothetical protein
MLQFGSGGFNLPPNFWIGLVVGGLGLAIGFVAYQAVTGTKYQRIHEGDPPDSVYRTWKASKFMARTSRGALFILALAGTMTLAGCGVALLIR